QASKHCGKLVLRWNDVPRTVNRHSSQFGKAAVAVSESPSKDLSGAESPQPDAAVPTSFAELEDYVCRRISRVLGYEPEQLDRAKGFFDLGMDSLTALELKNSMQRDLGIEVPSTAIFDYPDTNAMLKFLADRLQLSPVELDVGDQLDKKLAEIDRLLG
ncbi:MAG: acyl carrier protein, partial [Planctomycetota bacterium]